MSTDTIVASFKEKVSREIQLEPQGLNRFVVYTPFMFDDGDHYVAVLRQEPSGWLLSDEGHTLMHMSYSDVDLSAGTRAKVIEQVLGSAGVKSEAGELKLAVPNEAFGDALFSFVQAISRVTSAALWTRERVKRTFEEDLRNVIEAVVPVTKRKEAYSSPDLDPEGNYPVDYWIDSPDRPCFVFGITNDDHCREATITCLHYERKKRSFRSVAIFEDQATINRRALAQLSDVVGRQFSSLSARERIEGYLRDEVLAGK